MKHLRHPVVRLDLGGAGVESEPEALHERFGDPRPVEIGARKQVRVVVAGRAVHLSQYRDAGEQIALALEPGGEDRHFLAEGGGARRLPVGARQHGTGRVPVGENAQRLDQLADGRQQHPARASSSISA